MLSVERDIMGHGKIECYLDVVINDEIIQWILSFGGDAKVLEPQDLIEQIKSKALKVIEQYSKKAA